MATLLLILEGAQEYVVIDEEFGDGDDFDEEAFREEYGAAAAIVSKVQIFGDVGSFPVNRCLAES